MIYQLQDNQKLVLASGSPRLKEFLTQLGIAIEVRPSNTDETPKAQELVQDLVQRLALEKANQIAKQFPTDWVIAADTLVALDGEIFGKPNNDQEAFDILSKLSGKEHQVLGAVALVNLEQKIQVLKLSETRVNFNTLEDFQIRAYINNKEHLDKAGSYGIQGSAAHFVKDLKGSYTNVVGLDLSLAIELLLKYKIIKAREFK
jgi:septum formation protein